MIRSVALSENGADPWVWGRVGVSDKFFRNQLRRRVGTPQRSAAGGRARFLLTCGAVTILELIQKTTGYFEKAGVPTPRLDIEWLLAHALGLRRMDLYVQFERVLTEAELDRLRPLVKRRAAREPLQHLVGTVEFCGIPLAVDRRALIPRPETEILVDRALALLPQEEAVALDLGTGSGAIALALLAARPAWRVIATDLSAEALALARENAARLGLESRVTFREGDLFAPLIAGEVFDLVAANPPYLPTAQIASLEPEVREHDPRVALDGGAAGLDVIRRIADEAPKALKSGGRLLLEVGHDQADAVAGLLRERGWTEIAFSADLQGCRRIVEAQAAP